MNDRIEELIELFEMIRDSEEHVLNQKAKSKIAKNVLKILKTHIEGPRVNHDMRIKTEKLIIVFLEIPSVAHKSTLEKLKQKYEQFIQMHAFQGKGEIFRMIKENFENIFKDDGESRSS